MAGTNRGECCASFVFVTARRLLTQASRRDGTCEANGRCSGALERCRRSPRAHAVHVQAVMLERQYLGSQHGLGPLVHLLRTAVVWYGLQRRLKSSWSAWRCAYHVHQGRRWASRLLRVGLRHDLCEGGSGVVSKSAPSLAGRLLSGEWCLVSCGS